MGLSARGAAGDPPSSKPGQATQAIKAEDMVDWLKTFPLTADAFVDDAEVAAADIELGDTQTRVAFNVAKISSAANRNLVDALTCAQVLRSLGMRPAAETADALAPWLAKVEAAREATLDARIGRWCGVGWECVVSCSGVWW